MAAICAARDGGLESVLSFAVIPEALVKSLLVLVVAATTIGLAPARAEVAIAMAGPMTGAYAWMGEQNKRGVEAAVDELNARGGLLGQQVRVIIGDDACDAA